MIDDCPSTALDTVLGRHFERSWVCGWYYNAIYPGIYAGNLWKWYYTPHAQLDAVTNATANLLPYDVNYDGKTNMVDIGTTAASFGAIYGPPMSQMDLQVRLQQRQKDRHERHRQGSQELWQDKHALGTCTLT